ncbi:uncharacterized protein LOC143289735 [Babylonia areolata]|uniref:uncharacterized protein LOC143289735 n=1 Tax=Babylonia areolata TaxID=304850 RepID=UPI003FD603D8
MASGSSRQKPFASWVIFDIEATGLKRKPRITELCMLAVLTGEVQSTSRQSTRVVNKLQLCFNPESAIEAQASSLTGLYNDVLEHMATFTDQATLITGFLARLPQPVCMVAHNGHRFDFPLLQSELSRAECSLPPEAEVYCADSLEAFRVMDGLPAQPDWVVQREKEERKRKALACETNGIGSTTFVATCSVSMKPAQDDDRLSEAESRTVTPLNKRQQCSVHNTTDHSASVPKLTKKESSLTFGSQSSVSDLQLVEAYEAAIAQANTEDVAGWVSPVVMPMGGSLQSEQETTPVKDSTGTNTGHIPEHVVKNPPPLLVSMAERQRVARQLFEEESLQVQAEPPKGTSKQDSFLKDTPQLVHTADGAATVSQFSSQGSLSEEKTIEAMWQAGSESVTSLPPFQSGPGKPAALPQDKSVRSVTNQHVRPSGELQPPSLQVQGEASGRKTIDTWSASQTHGDPRLGLSASSSTQIQASKVTSASLSSSSCAPQHNGKTTLLSSSTSSKWSYKQKEIYKRQFGSYPDVAHHAEDDCITLLKIIISKRSDFMAFVENHAVKFDTVEPMY